MKRPWQAVVWEYQRGGTLSAFVARTLSDHHTQAGALRAVNAWLARHEVVTTDGCYHRDVSRAPFGEVRNAKRPEVCGATIDAPVCIVPSVGELGWTP